MTFLRSARAIHLGRVLATLLLAWAAARLCVWWHTPIPWMIGPLLATAAASLAGAPTASASQLRNGGQWVIGTALGLYFTPQVGALVASLWWAVALGIAWALWLGVAFGRWLQRVPVPAREGMSPQAWRATTYYAGAIGAASEMTLLAERAGARSDLVAAAHSLRVLMVTLALPFAMGWSGVSGVDVAPPPLRPVSGPGLLLLGGLTLLGIVLMRRTGRANPWFMGALLVTMGLTLSGVGLSAIPQALSNTAQLVIGVSLGVRFRPAFLHTAPRWLGAVALATAVMMVLCAGFGWALSGAMGLHPATLVLATSPGGIAEMAITAKVLGLGAAVVTAFQVCRLVAVLVLVEPVYRRWVSA